MVKDFVPCDLPRGKDGSVEEYFAKTTGYGYNDMISLPTLTKESILDNLSRRFKVRPRRRQQLRMQRRARCL